MFSGDLPDIAALNDCVYIRVRPLSRIIELLHRSSGRFLLFRGESAISTIRTRWTSLGPVAVHMASLALVVLPGKSDATGSKSHSAVIQHVDHPFNTLIILTVWIPVSAKGAGRQSLDGGGGSLTCSELNKRWIPVFMYSVIYWSPEQ